MGRYTTVQAYADNNPNMRTVQYDQTSSSAAAKPAAAAGPAANNNNNSLQVEKVDNPYGSTAGAGSGEFHVYRHARAREAQRLAQLDKAQHVAELDQEWDTKLNNWKNEEERQLNKRKRKRDRAKAAKVRKANLKAGGVSLFESTEQSKNNDDGDEKKKNGEEEEFDYTPIFNAQSKEPMSKKPNATAEDNQQEISKKEKEEEDEKKSNGETTTDATTTRNSKNTNQSEILQLVRYCERLP